MVCRVESVVTRNVYDDIFPITQIDIPWERFKNKIVFITGANGFISYYLVVALMIRNDLYQDNIKVIGMVRNEAKAKAKFGQLANRSDLELFVGDVCEQFKIDEKVDFIIHAASQASAYYFENDPVGTIDANLTGTSNVLKLALEKNAESSLFISSLKVYGQVKDGSTKLVEENIGFVDQTNYKNCYAIGKRAAETLCASYSKQYNLSVKIARPSYIYGPSSLDDDRVWAQFIANIVKNESILLKSSGAPYRSFCYVTDTAAALLTILLLGENAIPYNISAEHSDTTIRGFARTAVGVFPERNLTLSFEKKEDEVEPDVTKFTVTPEILDGMKLTALGWNATIDLEEGIKRAVRIVEEQQ
ncbi:MAG: NAD-dependent epimerase/dehydratase family protein [Anaerocolumna sp.]